MKFIFVSPIFCPNDNMFNRNINSLKSAIKFILPKVETFLLGGFCAKEDYWKSIDEIIKESKSEKIKIYKGKQNKGKAYNVNKMMRYIINKNTQFDYVLTCDSDIIFIDDIIHNFKKLNLDNHGIISPLQLEHCCHLIENLEKKIEIHNDKKITFYYSPEGTYIAGGCWFIKKESWEMVGGYQVLGVYCSDDANLLRDISNRGFKVCICDLLKVIHPHDDFPKYAKWKYKTSLKTMSLDEAIKDSEKFWEEYK